MPHLLVWSCGPVQDFIATARKGRDLWFGSWLISEVARAASQAAASQGARLIMPASPPTEDENVPNKLLVMVDDAPATIAHEMDEAARGSLLAQAELAFGQLEDRLPRGAAAFDRPAATAQVKDLLELAWASAPVGPSGLQVARRDAEALLAARKSHRTFAPSPGARAGVPKSSLDGLRESVVRTDDHDRSAAYALRLGMRPKERLSGVDVLKRHGSSLKLQRKERAHVASTSHFAAAPFLRAATEHPGYDEALRIYKADLRDAGVPEECLQGDGLDAHLLYANRLHEFVDGSGPLCTAENALRHFKRAVSGEDTPPLGAYYAILLGDGDRVGLALDRLDSEDALKAFSQALGTFARHGESLVEASGGQAIYAGGDDVLAFLPVDRALAAARALRSAFQDHLTPLVNPPPTFSLGIAVCHHLWPLDRALAEARAAERRAKQRIRKDRSVVGRNSWAIHLRRRGGAPVYCAGTWATEGPPFGSLAAFQTAYVEGGVLPRGLPYDLDVIRQTLEDPDTKSRIPVDVATSWARGILRQKVSAGPARAEATRIVADAIARDGLRETTARLLVARSLTGTLGDDA